MELTGYRFSKDGQATMKRLQLLDLFAITRQARLVCLDSDPEVRLHGHPARAIIGLPRVQGPWRGIFEAALADLCHPVVGSAGPEFVILISAHYWSASSKPDRERLIFHELCHLRQTTDSFGVPRLHDDGRPQLQVVPHDVESFEEEVRRYGPDASETRFEAAIHAHRARAAGKRARAS